MKRMLRPEWATKYIAGNPNGSHVWCYTHELEEWETKMPCVRCWKNNTNLCNKPCIEYEKWLEYQPFKERK